jgi:hypothetical protein
VEEYDWKRNLELCWTMKTRQDLGIKKQPTRENNVAYSFMKEVSVRGLNPFVYRTIGFIYLSKKITLYSIEGTVSI